MSKIIDNDPTLNGTIPPEKQSYLEAVKRSGYKEGVKPNYGALFSSSSSDEGHIYNVDPREYTDYMDISEINLKNLIEANKLRAQRQSVGEKVLRATENLAGDTFVGIIHDVGALGLLVGIHDEDNRYRNALTEWAERNRNPFGEVYSEDPEGLGWDAGSIINHISGVVQPLLQFGIEGIIMNPVFKGVTSIAAKPLLNYARAEKIATGINRELLLTDNAAKTIYNEGKKRVFSGTATLGAQALDGSVPRWLNSATIGAFASVDVAAQTYDAAYNHALGNGLNEEQSKEYALGMSRPVFAANTLIMAPMNFMSLRALYGTKASRSEMFNIIKEQEEKLLGNTANIGVEATSSYATKLKGVLGKLDADSKIAKDFINSGETFKTYAKHGWKSGLTFAGMDIIGNPNTAQNMVDASFDEYKRSISENADAKVSIGMQLNSFFSGVAKTIDDIQNGNDENGDKKLLLSFITGVGIGSGHRFANSRLGRTKVYTLNEEGKPIEIFNEEGEPTGKYEYKKMSNYRANKQNRQKVFDSYRNNLIKDLDHIEKASLDLEKIRDVGEKKAGITTEEVLQNLFDVNSYNMISRGGGEHLINSFRDIIDVDNSKDLGELALEKKIKVDDELKKYSSIPIDERTEEVKEVIKTLKAESEGLLKQARALGGKTEAMLQGLTDVKYNGKNGDVANAYKVRAENHIKDIEYLSLKFNEYYSKFGIGEAGMFELPNELLRLEQRILSNKRKIESMNLTESLKERSELEKNVLELAMLKYEKLAASLSMDKNDKYDLEHLKFINDKINNSAIVLKAKDDVKVISEFQKALDKAIAERGDILSNSKNLDADSKKRAEELNDKYKELQIISEKIDDAIDDYFENKHDEDYIYTEHKAINLLDNIELNNKSNSTIISLKNRAKEIKSDIVRLKKTITTDNKTKGFIDRAEIKNLEEINTLSEEISRRTKNSEEETQIMERILKNYSEDVELAKIGAYTADTYKAAKKLQKLKTQKGISDYIESRKKEIEESESKFKKEEKGFKDKINSIKSINELKKLVNGLNLKLKTFRNKKDNKVEIDKRVEDKINEETKKEEVKKIEREKGIKDDERKTSPRKEELNVEIKNEENSKSEENRGNEYIKIKDSKEDENVVQNKEDVSKSKINTEAVSNEDTNKSNTNEHEKSNESEVKKRTASNIINEKDPLYKSKKEIADLSSKASDLLRNSEIAKNNKESLINSVADYIDDLAYLFNTTSEVEERDIDLFKYINEAVSIISKSNSDNLIDNFKAFIQDIKANKELEDIASLLEAKEFKDDFSENLKSVLEGIGDSISVYRESSFGFNGTFNFVNFKTYSLPNFKSSLFDSIIKRIESGDVMYDIGLNQTKMKTYDYDKLIQDVVNLSIVERLRTNSVAETFSNVVEYIVGNYRNMLMLKSSVDRIDRQSELNNIRKIVSTISQYYNGKLIAERKFIDSKDIPEADRIESLSNIFVDDNFEISFESKTEFSDRFNKVFEDVDKIEENYFNSLQNEEGDKRLGAAVVANDVTDFRENNNEIVRKTNKKESSLLVKIGDSIKYEIDENYSGDVYYFDKGEYRKVKWNELKEEHKGDNEWLINHQPIKILHDGELIGYVPMLSSIHEGTVVVTENRSIEYHRGEIVQLRKQINDGANIGAITYIEKGHMNLADEYDLMSERVPELSKKYDSIGIMKRDGIYIGDKIVKSFNIDEQKKYKSFDGKAVILFKGNNGELMFSLVNRVKLDGSKGLSGRPDKEIENVGAVIEAMSILISDSKEYSKIDKSNINKALNNMIDIIDNSDNTFDVDVLSASTKSSNAILITTKSNGKTNSFSIRNEDTTIDIKSVEDIHNNIDKIINGVSKMYYNIRNDSLNKEVDILHMRDNKLITKKENYNSFLANKLLTRLVEKTLDLPEEFRSRSNEKDISIIDGEVKALVYTNNAPVYHSINNMKVEEKKSNDSKDKRKIEVSENKEEKESSSTYSSKALNIIETANKKLKKLEESDEEELGEPFIDDAEVSNNLSIKKMKINNNIKC